MLLKYLKQVQEVKDSQSNKGIWDKDAALSRVMNKESIFIKILNSFINENEKNIQDLEKSILEKDFNAMKIASHTIKGSTANIEASRLSELALEIEVLAKEESLINLDEKLNEIKSQSLLLIDILQDYLEGK